MRARFPKPAGRYNETGINVSFIPKLPETITQENLVTDILDWQLTLTTDHILQAQGADPFVIQSRRPALLESATDALKTGLPLLKPALAFESFTVERVFHNYIQLGGGKSIRSPLIASELKNAHTVNICVCTIGPELENHAREMMNEDPVLSLALDALCSAAVEQLISEVCQYFEKQCAASCFISQPLGPGMEGWTVAEGQPVIFQLVDTDSIGVRLTDSGLMLPVKSASFLMGVSDTPFKNGNLCDFCNLKEICKYRGNLHHSQ